MYLFLSHSCSFQQDNLQFQQDNLQLFLCFFIKATLLASDDAFINNHSFSCCLAAFRSCCLQISFNRNWNEQNSNPNSIVSWIKNNNLFQFVQLIAIVFFKHIFQHTAMFVFNCKKIIIILKQIVKKCLFSLNKPKKI